MPSAYLGLLFVTKSAQFLRDSLIIDPYFYSQTPGADADYLDSRFPALPRLPADFWDNFESLAMSQLKLVTRSAFVVDFGIDFGNLEILIWFASSVNLEKPILRFPEHALL